MSEWIDPGQYQVLESQQTDAIRLCTRPDGWVERFASDVLISYKTEKALERLRIELSLWAKEVNLSIRRVFARFLPKRNADRESPHQIWGDSEANLKSTTCEEGLQYGIDFAAGYSVGLFIDQRENRRYLRQLALRIPPERSPEWLRRWLPTHA